MTEKLSQENLRSENDITNQFVNLNVFEFLDFLKSQKEKSVLKIHIDLTKSEKRDFIGTARRLKAFLESNKPKDQERIVSIKCTEEQKMWEPNVFSSGVEWREA